MSPPAKDKHANNFRYAVIRTSEEDGSRQITAISQNWLSQDLKHFRYPPQHLPPGDKHRCIQKCRNPEDDWPVYPVEKVYKMDIESFKELDIMQRKYTIASESESTEPAKLVDKRLRKPNMKYAHARDKVSNESSKNVEAKIKKKTAKKSNAYMTLHKKRDDRFSLSNSHGNEKTKYRDTSERSKMSYTRNEQSPPSTNHSHVNAKTMYQESRSSLYSEELQQNDTGMMDVHGGARLQLSECESWKSTMENYDRRSHSSQRHDYESFDSILSPQRHEYEALESTERTQYESFDSTEYRNERPFSPQRHEYVALESTEHGNRRTYDRTQSSLNLNESHVSTKQRQSDTPKKRLTLKDVAKKVPSKRRKKNNKHLSEFDLQNTEENPIIAFLRSDEYENSIRTFLRQELENYFEVNPISGCDFDEKMLPIQTLPDFEMFEKRLQYDIRFRKAYERTVASYNQDKMKKLTSSILAGLLGKVAAEMTYNGMNDKFEFNGTCSCSIITKVIKQRFPSEVDNIASEMGHKITQLGYAFRKEEKKNAERTRV